MYYIEIPQEVTNENAITLVYYLAQQKNCNTLCNTTDGLINAHLCNLKLTVLLLIFSGLNSSYHKINE